MLGERAPSQHDSVLGMTRGRQRTWEFVAMRARGRGRPRHVGRARPVFRAGTLAGEVTRVHTVRGGVPTGGGARRYSVGMTSRAKRNGRSSGLPFETRNSKLRYLASSRS